VWVAVPLSALYVFLASMGMAPKPYRCLTEMVEDIQASGFDILLVEANCDAVGKWGRISAYLSRPGTGKSDLIFEYAPMEHNRLPSFSVDQNGKLSVSIAAVATVFDEEREWEGRSITYNVGKEYYLLAEKFPGK
jgi:hypothetical protein